MVKKSFNLPYYEEIVGSFDKKFTNREIDVLSCLVCGRASSISSFLSISGRTVEKHIQNIKNKLECCSREQILDYLEKSKKYTFLKTHYKNLVYYNKFQRCLKIINKKLASNTETFLDFDCFILNDQNHIVPVSEIKKNLQDVGFVLEKNKFSSYNFNPDEDLSVHKLSRRLCAISNIYDISTLDYKSYNVIIFFEEITDEKNI